MNIVVMKFGGTSVAGTEKINNIAKIVQSELKNNKLIVVLSAMAGETNKLQSYLDEFKAQNSIESDFSSSMRLCASASGLSSTVPSSSSSSKSSSFEFFRTIT